MLYIVFWWASGRINAFNYTLHVGTVWQANIRKSAKIRPRFFSFNLSATFVLDNSTHPRTIELTKFGMVRDNIIIPMENGLRAT